MVSKLFEPLKFYYILVPAKWLSETRGRAGGGEGAGGIRIFFQIFLSYDGEYKNTAFSSVVYLDKPQKQKKPREKKVKKGKRQKRAPGKKGRKAKKEKSTKAEKKTKGKKSSKK